MERSEGAEKKREKAAQYLWTEGLSNSVRKDSEGVCERSETTQRLVERLVDFRKVSKPYQQQPCLTNHLLHPSDDQLM